MYKWLIICSLLLIGCSIPTPAVGSATWYNQRMQEIQNAFDNTEIDKAEYLNLKNEADRIRAEYHKAKPSTRTHFGYSNYGGASIGLGVGF